MTNEVATVEPFSLGTQNETLGFTVCINVHVLSLCCLCCMYMYICTYTCMKVEGGPESVGGPG